MLLPLAVQAQAAAVPRAEPLQGQPVEATGQAVDVVEGVHQAVALELGVLPVWPEVSLAVRHLARQAGFQGLPGAVHAKVTQHFPPWRLPGGVARILRLIGVIHLLLTAGAETLHIQTHVCAPHLSEPWAITRLLLIPAFPSPQHLEGINQKPRL